MKLFGLYHECGEIQLVRIDKKTHKITFSESISLNKYLKRPFKFSLIQKKFITGLDLNDVLIKEISINSSRSNIVKKALPLQAEMIFPFDKTASIILPVVKRKDKNKTDLLLFGTTESKVQKTLSFWTSKKIVPHFLTAIPMALARFAQTYYPSFSEGILIHLGKYKTTFIHIKNNLPISHHVIEFGKNFLFEGLNANEIFDVSLIDETKKDGISKKWTNFKMEITKALYSFVGVEKASILLTGYWENIEHFEKFLFSKVKNKIHCFSQPTLSKKNFQQLQKFAIPIGFVLDNIKKDQNSLQFFQGKILPKKSFQSFGKKVSLLLTLSFVFLFGTLYFHKKHFKNQTEIIQKKLDDLIEFDEREMSRQLALDNNLSLPETLQTFQNFVRKENSALPYMFKALKPTSVLDWIYKHPMINDKIQIKSFHYCLESFPTAEEKNKPYLAKISLKLTGEDRALDSFYHALKIDANVDLDRDFTQTAENQITFYLKNR